METKEQLADKYAFMEYIDYGDLNDNAEKQIKEAFIEGFRASKKSTDKIILDTLNKLRSELSNEQTPKLGRTANFEKQVYYKACIEVLLKLQNKFKAL